MNYTAMNYKVAGLPSGRIVGFAHIDGGASYSEIELTKKGFLMPDVSSEWTNAMLYEEDNGERSGFISKDGKAWTLALVYVVNGQRYAPMEFWDVLIKN